MGLGRRQELGPAFPPASGSSPCTYRAPTVGLVLCLGLGHSGDKTDSMWLMTPAAQGSQTLSKSSQPTYSPVTVLGAPGRPEDGFRVPWARLLAWVGALDSHAAVVALSGWGRIRAQAQAREPGLLGEFPGLLRAPSLAWLQRALIPRLTVSPAQVTGLC